jgi:hypothetical protein
VKWVEQARWVEDGPFATSSGVSAGTDMALAVIAKLYGNEIAQQIAESTEYEWQQDSTRDPFVRFPEQGGCRGSVEENGERLGAELPSGMFRWTVPHPQSSPFASCFSNSFTGIWRASTP